MPTRKLVSLSIPLKAFSLPDTSSRIEATLPSGEYVVQDIRESAATTFVAVTSAKIADGTSWLCIRSGTNEYGKVFTREVQAAPRERFANDNSAVSEAPLVQTLMGFVGWSYDRDDPRYPSDIGSVSLPHAPPKANNCCTFVEALVAGSFSRILGASFTWTHQRHTQMMIDSAADYFSSVTALLEAGAGAPASADDVAPPSPWSVIQGWKTQWGGGHNFIVVDHHPETDKVLILESNCTNAMNGVGYRGIGLLSAGALPPQSWWTLENVWTWERVMSSYPLRHRCVLRVKDRSLAGLG